MSDEPQTEGFTFKDRRRAVSESTAKAEDSAPEASFTVNDRPRVSAEPAPAPPPPSRPAPTPPPPPQPGFGFGAPQPSSPAPQPPSFGGFGGGAPAGYEPGYPEEEAYDGGEGYPQQPTDLPDVRDLLVESLMTMRSMAAIRLGLAANPLTGQPDIDLEQARLALDSVAFLVDQLEPSLPHQDRLPLRSMVSDMRLRYVELARELGA